MVKAKLVEGIELDSESQPEFFDACVKAKSNVRPFPKESETQSKVYGEFVHWDLCFSQKLTRQFILRS
jgi:hypothetical protein